jgi:hypothetical protein
MISLVLAGLIAITALLAWRQATDFPANENYSVTIQQLQ